MTESLHLCATTRLAQTLRGDIPAGRTVWRTPPALTIDQWLGTLADEALLTGIAELPEPLDPDAERLLWEKVIVGSLNDASALFDIQGMAATAAEAHRLATVWQLRPAGQTVADEVRLFLGWQAEFERRCRAAGWTTRNALARRLIDLIGTGHFDLPPAVVLAGFDRLTPLEEALIAALGERGCRVGFQPEKPVDRGRRRAVACPDGEAECRAVAAWAREQLAARPAARLGIVAPDLAGVRERLEACLDDALHPASIRPDGAEMPRCFNFSLGRPLAEQPLIATALDLLGLGGGRGKLEQQRLSRLLLADGWSAASVEADERARLDAEMRRRLPAFTSVSALAGLAGRLAETAPALCPATVRALTACAGELDALPRRQPPGAWAAHFRRVLTAAGWPGDRPLSSHEYQAVRAFEEVLAGFGKLDALLGATGAGEAVRRLRERCRQRIFQPETRGRPAIQVLGVLESAGLDFDALWVMGMTDDQWPPAPRPNPLLPAQLLREAGAAHASAEIELDFARRVHARLAAAAPDVVFSRAMADGSRLLRPSPLIAGVPAWEGPPPAATLAERLAGAAAAACVAVDDAQAPPVAPGEKVAGGSWLLRAQALCPAWAYYQYRLGAEAMDTPAEGLDPAARGTLVHAALEAFWTETRDSRRLAALDEAALVVAIADAVRRAIACFEQERRVTLAPRFRELEAARLEALLGRWLAVEAGRPADFEVIACEQPAEVEIEGIRVKMVVDRIDRLADGRQIIIDYKTGAAIDVRNWAAQRITEPQLPIYAALVNEEVAAVVFAKVLLDKPAFAGVADDKDLLPGVQGIGDDKQKIFDPAVFPDWVAVVTHWRERLHAVAREVRDGRAGVCFADARALQYCEVLPILRLPERRRLLAAALGPGGIPAGNGAPAR